MSNKPKRQNPRGFKESGSMDSFINQHGIEFTWAEREAYRQAVNSLKRKQKRILSDTTGKYDLVKTFYQLEGGGYTGMLSQVSTGMQQFKTRKQFEHAMENVMNWKKKGSEWARLEQTKANYIESIKYTFAHDKEFMQYLINMDVKEFFKVRGHEVFEDFSYYNSTYQDDDDVYSVRLVHQFGFLTMNERLSGDTAINPLTNEKITSDSVNQLVSQTQATIAKKAKKSKRGKTTKK